MRKIRLQRALFILIIILMVISPILIYPFTVAPKGATVSRERFISDISKYGWREGLPGNYRNIIGKDVDEYLLFDYVFIFRNGPRHYGEINMMVRTFLYVRYRNVPFNLKAITLFFTVGFQSESGIARIRISTKEFNALYNLHITSGMREREKIEVLSETIIRKTGYERRSGRRVEVR